MPGFWLAAVLVMNSLEVIAQDAPLPTPDLISADRPGIADGSGVIAPGQFQIELGFQREFRNEEGIRTRTSLLPTLIRAGISRRLEGRIETNGYTWLEATDAGIVTNSSGWSSTSLGVKYRLRDATESLGAIVRVFPSSGSPEFGTGHFTADARLAADLPVSRTLSLNPNIGIARYEGSGGQTFTAALLTATLSYQPTDRLNPFLDIAVQRPSDAGASASVVFDAGLGYIIGRNFQLDVSIGTGTRGTARPFVAVGMSARSRR